MLKKSRIFLFFDPKIPNATPFGGRSLTERCRSQLYFDPSPPKKNICVYVHTQICTYSCRDHPDCQTRQLQPLEAWASLAETDRSGGWEHQSHLLRPTASAAGTIGLSFQDRRLQQLEPLVSVSETDGSSSWNHWSHFLRPTDPAVGSIGLTC